MEQELKQLEQKLNSIVSRFKDELSSIRTNRPTTKLVEDIKVDYLEQRLTVKQLCSLSIVPPREIVLNVWDKNSVSAVAKAIEGVHLGLSVVISGNLIRINLPPLTDERRKEFIKIIKTMTEKERVNIRLLRDEVNKKTKANPDEDLRHFLQKRIQESVDKTNRNIEDLLENKIKEIND